jgi:hypothetical protein
MFEFRFLPFDSPDELLREPQTRTARCAAFLRLLIDRVGNPRA